MKTKLALFLSIIGILLSVVACSMEAGQAADGKQSPEEKEAKIMGIEVSYDEFAASKHISREIAITYPDTLQVTLYSNSTTGYSWSEAAEITDLEILQQESHEYAPSPSNGERLGVGGEEVWRFKTLAKGETALSMKYNQPWAGGEKGTWTFDLAITVK